MKTPFVLNNYDNLAAKIDEYADELYDNYDEDIVSTAISSLGNDSKPSKELRTAESEWVLGVALKHCKGKNNFKKLVKVSLLEKQYACKVQSNKDFIKACLPLEFLLKSAKFINDNAKKSSKEKGVFGKYAWANDRSLSSLTPFEKDEPTESLAYNQLGAYFGGNTKTVTSNTVSTLKSILKKGKYSDIIKAPTKKFVMRGMNLNRKQLQTILGDKEFNKIDIELRKIHDVLGFRKKILKSFTFTPKFNVSSWTTDSDIATNFSTEGTGKNGIVGIILYANVSDNPDKLIQCDDGLYNIIDFADNSHEHEVLAMGNIKVSSIVITY